MCNFVAKQFWDGFAHPLSGRFPGLKMWKAVSSLTDIIT